MHEEKADPSEIPFLSLCDLSCLAWSQFDGIQLLCCGCRDDRGGDGRREKGGELHDDRV